MPNSGIRFGTRDELTCELHRVCLQHVYGWAGTLRKGDLHYPVVASPFWRIRQDLTALFDDLATRLELAPSPPAEDLGWVVELVAWFQHRYVQIHPFTDFNGRTGRMLSTYLMLVLGVGYLEIQAETGEDRDRYIDAMRAGDQFDLRPLQVLVRDALDPATDDPPHR